MVPVFSQGAAQVCNCLGRWENDVVSSELKVVDVVLANDQRLSLLAVHLHSVSAACIRHTIYKPLETFSGIGQQNGIICISQIVYYFSTYCDLLEQKRIALGDEINVVVPTGNFGNIT